MRRDSVIWNFTFFFSSSSVSHSSLAFIVVNGDVEFLCKENVVLNKCIECGHGDVWICEWNWENIEGAKTNGGKMSVEHCVYVCEWAREWIEWIPIGSDRFHTGKLRPYELYLYIIMYDRRMSNYCRRVMGGEYDFLETKPNGMESCTMCCVFSVHTVHTRERERKKKYSIPCEIVSHDSIHPVTFDGFYFSSSFVFVPFASYTIRHTDECRLLGRAIYSQQEHL